MKIALMNRVGTMMKMTTSMRTIMKEQAQRERGMTTTTKITRNPKEVRKANQHPLNRHQPNKTRRIQELLQEICCMKKASIEHIAHVIVRNELG